jgi:hypothetical protein
LTPPRGGDRSVGPMHTDTTTPELVDLPARAC